MTISQTLTIVVIGGGAAGFFGAIACAQAFPQHCIILLEKTRVPLSKVKISGGGRCNVTHACFDPSLLIQHYPRGSQALRGPFARFQPRDTMEWFESRGVSLKIEGDGRIFPVTDRSESIINCLLSQAKKQGVILRTECSASALTKQADQFNIHLSDGEEIIADRLLVCTGSSSKGLQWVAALGHTIIPPVPSLFTFNIPHSPLEDLSGTTVPSACVKILNTSLEQTGALLITHWGFSGPAILKLSAWGARVLHDLDYRATLVINWVSNLHQQELIERLSKVKNQSPSRLMSSDPLFELSRNLWRKLLILGQINPELRWSEISKKELARFANYLQHSTFSIQGKTTFKDEFVTCGGVSLKEVDFKTMESRVCPGLFFAGEVLDIDGITGGFNFQNAWTTAWIAGTSMGL